MVRTDEILFKIFRMAIVAILFIAFNLWFYDHYVLMVRDWSSVLKSLIIIDVALLILIFSVSNYKTLINPVGLYSFFIFAWGYSYLRLSTYQATKYSIYTEIIIVLTIISFLAGTYWSQPMTALKRAYFSPRLLKVTIFVIILFCLMAFLSEIRQIGYFPIFNLSNKNYEHVVQNLIPFVHYFVLFISLVPAILYVYYKSGIIGKYAYILVMAVSIFALLNMLGRQNLLMLGLSFFFAYNYFNKVSNIKIALFGCLWVVFFIYMGSVRDDAETLEIVNSSLKHYSGIFLDTSIFETYLTLYSSQNFTTLNKIILLSHSNDYFGFGIYTFRPVISFFFIDRIGIIRYDKLYDGAMQLGTYALEPFLDFSIIGVILINFIYGRICITVYNNYISHKNYFSIIAWSLVAYCIIMTSFTNYFDTFLIWFALLLSYVALNLKKIKTENKSGNTLY